LKQDEGLIYYIAYKLENYLTVDEKYGRIFAHHAIGYYYENG
jgi:hypothetical protein